MRARCGEISREMHARYTRDTREIRVQMDRLNFFMRQEGLPDEMRRRLREYFRECFALNESASRKELLLQMSPALQVRRTSHVSRVYIACNLAVSRA